MTNYGKATEAKIAEVMEVCRRYGRTSVVALAGVPGTGKSFIASIAAQRLASDPLLVREIQFHPSFSYEEFVEGLRIGNDGGISVKPGVFLEWNQAALDDTDRTYVLLIEELTRANLPSTLGELLTYIEYRERSFLTMYSRRPVHVAPNLLILATYNPTDRSALELDNAVLRRLRVIEFRPDPMQLEEMLSGRGLREEVVSKLQALFEACERQHEDYEFLMPFGHGVFAQIQDEQPDLHHLWQERIKHLLYRPLVEPHPFAETIARHYPWRDPNYEVPDELAGDDQASAS